MSCVMVVVCGLCLRLRKLCGWILVFFIVSVFCLFSLFSILSILFLRCFISLSVMYRKLLVL